MSMCSPDILSLLHKQLLTFWDPEGRAVHNSVWPHDSISSRTLNALEGFIQHQSTHGLLCLSLHQSALLPAPVSSGSLKGLKCHDNFNFEII